MLKLAGEGIYKERIESLLYNPGLKTTGDLEAGTHTIVPTSRPAIGGAQYSTQLTLPAPSDARFTVKRIACRLAVNITNLGTATHVLLSVRVDVDDSDHELFSEDWTSTGTKLTAVDTHATNKTTIFNLLKNGGAHTFYFLFWADAASQAQLDQVQLWEGVGSSDTGGGSSCLELAHTGWLAISDYVGRQGTGTVSQCIFSSQNAFGQRLRTVSTATELAMGDNTALCFDKLILSVFGTVTTDLNYLDTFRAILRSEA
ncbi:MAG: hypothetical protein V1894_05990 [Chloroflexota bacterium]